MRSLFLKCTAAAATIAMCACSGGGNGGSYPPASPSTPTSPTSSNAVTITIRQNGAQSFSPNPAPAGGQLVVFMNSDGVTHRVALNDGTVDTGDIAPGATSRMVTMPANGANYYCTIHPSELGSVSGASGAPPPPCEGIYCGY